MDDRLELLAEREALHASLSPEERDDLLQSLLIAAAISGETVIRRLEERLLDLAGREFIEGLPK